MAIDIGVEAIDRNNYTSSGRTYFALDNPANASGTIDTIKIWAYTNLTGCRVGTFYLFSGTFYKCRDSVNIGDVPSGSEQTFSELSLAVEAGDYIGFYVPVGNLECSSFGFAGLYWVSDEYIDPGDAAEYALASGDAISLYGTGTEVGGVTHEGAATLSGIGTLAGIGRGTFIGKTTLAGIGTLASIGRLIATGKAALSGVGSLTGIGHITAVGKATLAGVGELATIGTVILGGITHYGSAILSGTGSLATKGVGIFAGKAALAGSGTLTALGNIIAIGKATLSGIGSLTATGTLGAIRYGIASLSGKGTLSAIGTVIARIRNTQPIRVNLSRLPILRMVISRMRRTREV